jgi:hypothetical protein
MVRKKGMIWKGGLRLGVAAEISEQRAESPTVVGLSIISSEIDVIS